MDGFLLDLIKKKIQIDPKRIDFPLKKNPSSVELNLRGMDRNEWIHQLTGWWMW